MTRPVAIALTVLTGFTGLVYEVTWQKYLATLLGSQAEATSAVLAIFLGGLSVGYAVFGRVTRRRAERAKESGEPARLLIYYAWLEGLIGVGALLFPLLFGAVSRLSYVLPRLPFGLDFAFDLVLCTLLVGPFAFLMGGTIPILTLALSSTREEATRIHAWVYGFNTAGAAAGALASAFVLIPTLGLAGVLFAMGVVNLLAACIFAWLGAFGSRVEPVLEAQAPTDDAVAHDLTPYAIAALLSGFAMMALQTLLNRVAGLAFGSSHFTFAVVVGMFVSCIAVGSLAVSCARRIPPWVLVTSQWLLVLLLYFIYPWIEDAPYWAFVLRGVFSQHSSAFYPYQLASAGALFLVFALPIGLSGALLPLLFDHLRSKLGELGSVAGRLYSWNTVGSLLGALIGGYLLLFWLDLDQIYRVSLAALIVQAALLSVLVTRLSPVAMAALVVLPALVALSMLPGWQPKRLIAGLFRQHVPADVAVQGPDHFFSHAKLKEIIYHEDGPNSTISVRSGDPIDGRINRDIVTNGKSDGNLVHDYPTMSLAALVPALLAEDPKNAFVIGFGTGVTAGELAALESVEQVEVAEISSAVIEAAPLFDGGNLAASRSPKVRIERSDAYRTLMSAHDRRFDVIVSEPSNPWVAGVEMVYSAEFLRAAREHLSPGGVFAQWFHLYEVDLETIELIFRTYASVFPQVSVWFTLESDLLLLGFDRDVHALDVVALAERFQRTDYSAGFARAGVDDFPSLLAHELLPLGVLQAASLKGPLHTLEHPILSDMAARAFFVGHRVSGVPKYANVEGARLGRRNSLLRKYAKATHGGYSARSLEAVTRITCKRGLSTECATLLTQWRRIGNRARAEDYLHELRRKSPATPALEEGNLRMLAVLLDGRIREVAEDKSLARARSLSAKFIKYYHHAAPFQRRALAAAWDACRGEGCAEAREMIEAEIGAL